MDSAEAYEQHAQEFLRNRDQSQIGSKVVERWTKTFSNGASVLELACGGGEPITRSLLSADLKLWAIDSSPTLVKTFKTRFPNIPVQCSKVQTSNFFNQSYNGVIAIGLMFLLPKTEQLELISKVSGQLKSGGQFLFTAPIETGSWVDRNTGLRCESLGQVAYENGISEAGLSTVATFSDVGQNNYYDTKKLP